MSEVLTRQIAPGYQIELIMDMCGCTFTANFARTSAGFVSVDPTTLKISYEFTEDPFTVGSVDITNPFRPAASERPDLPPFTSLEIVEAASLADWMQSFYTGHYKRFLTESELADPAYLAHVEALAEEDAGNMTSRVVIGAAASKAAHNAMLEAELDGLIMRAVSDGYMIV